MANTTMISDLAKAMSDYDRNTMSVQIPECFDHLKGNDAMFEMITSNTLQTLRLVYSGNIVTHSIAVVLVHTRGIWVEYPDAVKIGA